MSYHLIYVLILHQELRYLYFYYQCELISAPKIMTLFPVLPSVRERELLNENQILCGTCCICIYLDLYS